MSLHKETGYSTKYYANNVERIRANARLYSAKVRSDPVKKQQINAQKREAMRRLKMRRKAAEQQTQILATAKDEVEEKDSSKDVPETNADLIHLPIYVEYHQEDAEEPEQVIGQLNDVGEEQEEKQQYTIEEESQLSSQSQPPEQPMSSSEYFPFAAGLADCLQLEDQGKFIAYIEDCAQLYMKHFMERINKSKLPEVIMRHK